MSKKLQNKASVSKRPTSSKKKAEEPPKKKLSLAEKQELKL